MKRTICVNFVSVLELLSHGRLKEPLDCSLPGSSVHGVPQARILEWAGISSSTMVIKLATIIDIINLSFATHTPL